MVKHAYYNSKGKKYIESKFMKNIFYSDVLSNGQTVSSLKFNLELNLTYRATGHETAHYNGVNPPPSLSCLFSRLHLPTL